LRIAEGLDGRAAETSTVNHYWDTHRWNIIRLFDSE
jgi:hypothetical protein